VQHGDAVVCGLELDQDRRDASDVQPERRRRFDESGVLEKLFDQTVEQALAKGWSAAT